MSFLTIRDRRGCAHSHYGCAALAQFEQRLIQERTLAGLAVARALTNARLRGMGATDHLMLDLRHECRMCTFGTGSSAVSGEGENLTNTLKNCAKTVAKINVRQER